MQKKILIIDDDEKLNNLLKDFLSKFNFLVSSATTPSLGLELIKKNQPDLVILDVMLPGMDGFEVCKLLRKDYQFPIIMLTARGDVTDRIVGLELGADDYLPKPFEPRELVARMQSVLRRSSISEKQDKARYGKLIIDYKKHTASINGQLLDLTSMEFELLTYFSKNQGIVLSRDDIFEHVKGLDSDTYDRSIDVMISRLRSKLGDDPKKPVYLRTIWGSGYKFIGSENDEEA